MRIENDGSVTTANCRYRFGAAKINLQRAKGVKNLRKGRSILVRNATAVKVGSKYVII